MTPNYRNIIEPRDLADWIPWEERFSCAPVDKPVSGQPAKEPNESASGFDLRPGKASRTKPLGECNRGLPHVWLNHGATQARCNICRRTAMKHNLPPETKIWTKAELRTKVAPRLVVPGCSGHSHDWRAWDGAEESRRIRCAFCFLVVPGVLA